jgi:OmpA-OmpF porin, OOP family
MALFDGLIGELASKYGVGAQAGPLVRELLQAITAGPGGLGGFLDKLKRSGLGPEVSSWLGATGTTALPQQEVESALGSSVLNGIASRLGLGAGVVGTALGYALPKAVGLLTPGGILPQNLPAEAQSLLSSSERVAAHPLEQVRPLHMAVLPDPRTHVHWWGVPLALVLGVAALAWFLAPSRPPAPVALPPAPVENASVQPAQPWLWLSNNNGVVHYSGAVRDQASRTSIVGALGTAFGADKIKGYITVNPDISAAPWPSKLSAALNDLKVNGLQTLFSGNSVSLGGLASDADHSKLASALGSVFGGGVVFGTIANKLTDLVSDTTNSASAALAALPANHTAADVANALSLSIINFPSGSAEIPAASEALLRQAAERIKQLPAGTVIEIAGYTDNTGDPATNVSISQQRAEAVRNTMIQAGVNPSMLVAKGYGGANPIAPNDTDAGRFRNQRIEYHVLKS